MHLHSLLYTIMMQLDKQNIHFTSMTIIMLHLRQGGFDRRGLSYICTPSNRGFAAYRPTVRIRMDRVSHKVYAAYTSSILAYPRTTHGLESTRRYMRRKSHILKDNAATTCGPSQPRSLCGVYAKYLEYTRNYAWTRVCQKIYEA